MPELRVGVAIPVRDGERWLAACLQSVAAQTRPVAEVVVVDDGSQDGSAAVARAFAPLVRVEQTPPAGIGAARNRAIASLRTELILSLDADDLLLPRSVELGVGVLAADPGVELVFGYERRFAELHAGEPVALGEARPAFRAGAMLMRRSAYERIGPFSGGKVTDGLDFMLRARELDAKQVVIEEQIAWRRVHGANNSIRHRAEIGEFAQAIKASLDRRRASEQSSAEPAA
jgi:glycosyltransferase involved in cell wall biosynthesis